MSNRAVIFDVDGVLVDSYQPHFQSWVLLFQELDYEYTEEQFRAGFGRTSHEILKEWSEAQSVHLTESDIERLDERKESLYRNVLATDFRAIDGATELIEDLVQTGFLLGIGSSGPPENVQAVTERLPGGGHFTAVVTRADITRGKPDPEVFLRAASQLEIPAEQCAVVEDAVHGIEAANRAGMVSIALTGTATRSELAAARLTVDSLRELSAGSVADLFENPR